MKYIPPMNYSDYTAKVSTDPCFYGSECSQDEGFAIASRLQDLIKDQFKGIKTESFNDGNSSDLVDGPDDEVSEAIRDWISDNWTEACIQ